MNTTPLRSVILASLVLVARPLVSQQVSSESFEIRQIIGSWEGKNTKGEVAVIQFQPGGTVQFTINGEPLVPMTPNEGSLLFKVQQDKSPMWLDLVGIDGSGKELGRIKFIFQLLSPKEMKIQVSEDLMVRPENFNESNSSKSLILKKYY